MKPSSRVALLGIAILLGGAWLWRLCEHDRGIPFLPQKSGGNWILYPKPLDSIPHHIASTTTVFKRPFEIERQPSVALLSIRCFKAGSVTINGQSVSNLFLDGSDWKTTRMADIRDLIRKGTNEISVTVSNSAGPPVLWLVLQCDGTNIASDSTWQASCLGAAWQNAALATAPPIVRIGNPLFGRERMAGSLRRTWLTLLLIAISAGLVWFIYRRVVDMPNLFIAGSENLTHHEPGLRSFSEGGSRMTWHRLRDPIVGSCPGDS